MVLSASQVSMVLAVLVVVDEAYTGEVLENKVL